MTRIILASRAAPWALLAVVVAAGVSAVYGLAAIVIDVSPVRPNKLPITELCAVASATVLTLLTRPRLWEWERVARTHRARVVAALVCVANIALPVACALPVVPRLPDGTAWAWVCANVVVIAAIVQLVAPLTGPLWAGLTGLVLWFVFGALHNIAPAVGPYLPTSSSIDADGRWTVALLLGFAAVLLHAKTHGALAWTRAREDSFRA
ncbi:hypothetical protein ABZ863_09100 [Saccharomonospora sp. NPDC046836]|uniref:hypothetical protein n=1 Tax=Saccharomonospora sp. NPDC046836 TaxID=3156921 RepID=UPI0033DB1CBE